MMPDFEEYINEWLLKAEHDIVTAQRLLEIEPKILDIACFHCQQAIEKSLKAFLLYNGREIEKTHDVIFLLTDSADFDPIFSTIDPLNINMFAVQARYPGSGMTPDSKETTYYYQLAIRVNSMVKERIVFPQG